MLRKLVPAHVSATEYRKNYDRKIANKSFKYVVKLKYLGLILTMFYSQENEVKAKGKVVLVQPQRHSQATAPIILDLICVLNGGKGSASRRDHFAYDAH
jgi:hypothetical protein